MPGNLLCYVIPLVVIFATMMPAVNSQALTRKSIDKHSSFGCECADFIWMNKDIPVGNCRSVNLDGFPICYLHQPNRCRDARLSNVFCGMEVTEIGCGCRVGRDGFCVQPGRGGFRGREPQSGFDVQEALPQIVDDDGFEMY